jgi:ankyrin repeat protein
LDANGVADALQAGASANEPDVGESTPPLHIVLRVWEPETAEAARACALLLLEYGVSPDAHDEYGESLLQVAAFEGNDAIVKMLIDHGADVSAEHDENDLICGSTALHRAVCGERENCIIMLIKAGADVNADGFGDGSALYYAIKWRLSKVYYDFIRAGAKFPYNWQTSSGYPESLRTYLHRIQAADSLEAFEKQCRESLEAMLIPKFPRLPAELVRVVVGFWGHPGYY